MKNRLIRCAVVLTLMLVALLTASALAETRRGNCGKNNYPYTEYDSNGEPYTVYRNDHVQWELTDGCLTIWGSEDMEEFRTPPWGQDICSLTIENGVTSISTMAFSGCKNLPSVSIPASVKTIGFGAFSGCSSLTSVTIPSTVSSLVHGCFSYCENLQSAYIYCKNTGEGTFGNCSSLTNVYLSGNVAVIGENSFGSCTALESISIPASVTTISVNAFSDCTSLKTVTLREGLQTIGAFAFSNCESLTGLAIPDSVSFIGDCALNGCFSLTNLSFPLNTEDGNPVGFSNLERLFGNFGGPDPTALTYVTVTRADVIPEWFFGSIYHNFDSVICISLPDTITSIGTDGFSYLDGLHEIALPNSLVEIGYGAFLDSGLREVVLPDSVKTIGGMAFAYCSELVSIHIPSGVESIGYSALMDTALTELTIPGTVKEIGARLLSGCDSLECLTMPLYHGLDYYFYSEGFEGAGYAPESLKTVTVTDVEMIPSFGGGSYISTLNFPESAKELGSNSFYGCTSLMDLALPEGIVSIGADSFYNCTSLTSLVIPESVTSIGSRAFEGCSNLKSIVLPEALTSLGTSAFMYCSSLVSVDIPDGLTTLDGETFGCCSSLERVNIRPSSKLEFISGVAFWCSDELRSVTIPDSVKEIEYHAFRDRPNLTIRCNHYSVADWYAQEASIPVIYLDVEPETLVTLRCPANIREIETEAFLGISASGAEIPDGCVVGSRAFAGSDALLALFVTGMEVSLPADVIEGSSNAWIYCYPDSQAAADCVEYDLPCKLLY